MRRILTWLRRALAGLVLAALALVIAYRFVDPPLTPLMVMRVVEGLAAGRPVGIRKAWVDLEDVSPGLLRAVIAAEDARFFVHWGVDLAALRAARAYNVRQGGRRVRGGSTITMQCARNVFLWQGRSYVRKGLEIPLALLLELVWGKARILEVYLNVAEWGPGLYGAGAAARRYFGVPAARLDAQQAALLAAALPSPLRRNPTAPTPFLRRKAATIARRATRIDLEPLSAADRAVRGAPTLAGRAP